MLYRGDVQLVPVLRTYRYRLGEMRSRHRLTDDVSVAPCMLA
jgi:hypothetical protein